MENRENEIAARGQVCIGVVTRIAPFGAFVDISGVGIEGFVSVPELSWRRFDSISDVLSVGDVIRVVVLDVDPDGGQVRLSLKAAGRDPFSALVSLVGNVVEGLVTKVATIGSFVRIEDRPDGFEGLIPVDDLRAMRVPSEGETLHVRVVDVDLERRRIRLAPVFEADDGP